MARHPVYKGETPIKSVTRSLVWLQHAHLLRPAAFKATPHVFLASRIAGDIAALRDMGVPNHHIWAVEKERDQYEQLLARHRREGFRLFVKKIETVMASHPNDNIRSVYLDYCGNLDGTAHTTSRVVALIPEGSVLSITLFKGRELHGPEDREHVLLHRLREFTSHQVTLTQSIYYLSVSGDHAFGPPMATWTFFIGAMTTRSKMRFDLHGYAAAEIKRLAATPGAVRELWKEHLNRANVRRKAAVKANATRALYTGETRQVSQSMRAASLSNFG